MDKALEIDTVARYNALFGFETIHPLVGIFDLSKAEVWPDNFNFKYELYCIYLKDAICGKITYGRRSYDYQAGSIVSFSPGQIANVELEKGAKPSGLGIIFHPDMIKGTVLFSEINRFTFLSYSSNEALHVSDNEKKSIIESFDRIKKEILYPIDRQSKRIIIINIMLFLELCLRYYDRQFITRSYSDNTIVLKFENLVEEYLLSTDRYINGIPGVKYFADKLNLSPNYFGDLIKKHTGKTAQEYILIRWIDKARILLSDKSKTISEVAHELGYVYPQHFTRMFRRMTGISPSKYRKHMYIS